MAKVMTTPMPRRNHWSWSVVRMVVSHSLRCLSVLSGLWGGGVCGEGERGFRVAGSSFSLAALSLSGLFCSRGPDIFRLLLERVFPTHQLLEPRRPSFCSFYVSSSPLMCRLCPRGQWRRLLIVDLVLSTVESPVASFVQWYYNAAQWSGLCDGKRTPPVSRSTCQSRSKMCMTPFSDEGSQRNLPVLPAKCPHTIVDHQGFPQWVCQLQCCELCVP